MTITDRDRLVLMHRYVVEALLAEDEQIVAEFLGMADAELGVAPEEPPTFEQFIAMIDLTIKALGESNG